MSSHAAPLRRPPALRVGGRQLTLSSLSPDALWTITLGILLAAVALRGGGGLQLGPTTQVEVGLLAFGGLTGGAAVLTTRGRPLHGLTSLALFGLLAMVTVLSILWSVAPDEAFLESGRTLAYLATFGTGVALARMAPERWTGLLGATILATAVVSGYALLTKIFPGALASGETYARLREPFGYWNAVGLMAALGAPGCLWLGARRTGHAALNAIAYPVLAALLLTVLLAYSRGSLLALVVGCGFWFAVVPLRLRGAAVLATSALGAVAVAAWAFGQPELSKDRVPLDLRATAGHELGVAIVLMLAVLLVAGLAIGFAFSRRAPDLALRRRAGVAILVALSLVPFALVVGLSLSERGLGGSVSKGWTELTDPKASTPANEPGRLTAVSSVRARYYDQSLKIFKARPVYGAGAGGFATARLRFRDDDLDVRHSHGYWFQTAADLGLLGLLTSAALFVAWCVGAARSTGLRLRRRLVRRVDAEHVGLLTLTSIVVVFGVHSLVDWTWFVPGTAVLALLGAGWVVGRGPRADGPPETYGLPFLDRLRAGLRDRVLGIAAISLLIVAVAAAWAAYQPKRAVDRGNDALALLDTGKVDVARDKTASARSIDPLSVEPLFERAVVEVSAGRIDAARQALEQAVRLQPQNPVPWLRLADFELTTAQNPRRALQVLGPALYLDPRSPLGVTLFLDATRRSAAS